MRTNAVAFVLLLVFLGLCLAEESAPDGVDDGDGANSTAAVKKDETLAEKMDGMLKREFTKDAEEAEQDVGKTFNETAKQDKASMETVVVISHKPKKNASSVESTAVESPDGKLGSSGQDGEQPEAKKSIGGIPQEGEQDVDRIVDSHDNEYVLSKSKELAALVVDPVLIQDLTILISASASVGWIFEGLGQPVINGYLTAGSAVGPGGFMMIKELVQVESLAQLGVHFLLFYLGLEFSMKKMRAVGGVALVGGLLEMVIFVGIAVLMAGLTKASVKQSLFVGALVSLSSTSVVIKCLEANGTGESRHGQITIGTLILQDCTVGLMFAVMPLLEETSDSKLKGDNNEMVWVLFFLFLKLLVLVIAAIFTAKVILPPLMGLLARYGSWELFQVTLTGLCLAGAWGVGMLGLSHELGAFIAGAMISATDQHEYAVKAIDGIRTVFTALFITSIGLVMSPRFLIEHFSVLTVGTLAVILCKALVIFGVVKAFNFDTASSIMVAMSLAQISEFAFVLLSMAVDMAVIGQEVYLMLLGVAALSLLVTPGLILFATKFVEYFEIDVTDIIPVTSEFELQKLNRTGHPEGSSQEAGGMTLNSPSGLAASTPHVVRRNKGQASREPG